MALHFNCSPSELDQEQVLDYLQYLKSQSKTPSSSYFKHTVYGLRFAYRVLGIKQHSIFLPKLKFPKKLPVVLSQNELKALLNAPNLLKHKLVIALLYGCGLRRFELLNIQLPDIDFDRQMLHIREGKGKKDRYVPLGNMLCRGLKVFIENEHPFNWLFNGKSDTGQLQRFSETGVQWIIRQALLKTAIKKRVTSHVLRHTYATHLLEMGTDIISLKELLGHTDIRTTMVYLHVAQLDKHRAFCPLDKLYPPKQKS